MVICTIRNKTEFNIVMGAFDSAEPWELIESLLLLQLRFIFDIKDIIYYRDDAVILLRKRNPIPTAKGTDRNFQISRT